MEGVDPRDMLADEPENDTAALVESLSTDAAGSLASKRDFSPSSARNLK